VETLPKYRNARTCVRVVLGGRHQHANPPHSLGLLRTRRERPYDCRAAEKRDELASPHIRSRAQETGLYRLKRTLIGAETGIKTIAAVHSQCR